MLNIFVLDFVGRESLSLHKKIKQLYMAYNMPIKSIKELNPESDLEKAIMKNDVFLIAHKSGKIKIIEASENLHRTEFSTFIVFVIEKSADLRQYIKPGIQPSGILYAPPELIELKNIIEEIYREYMYRQREDDSPSFTFKAGGETYIIPLNKIIFFESRQKKIAVKTHGQEISFYSNFKEVFTQLTDDFVRCHNSYVVNRKFISSLSLGKMRIVLEDGCDLPISRKYKDELKELVL